MSNDNITKTVIVDDVHENTSQELISITSDKLKLALLEHLRCIEDMKAWQTPASLVVAVALVFATSTFKDSFGIKGDVWLAFFMFLMAAFVVWLALSLLKLRRRSSIDALIEAIKRKKTNGH
ncbi:hypothetical protein [Pseudomonas sp. RIT623]|uniref:hypothetical protein n=1 Tax=Pseudomonas sp. RIT623 TaxID=2559075 RepID=UPI0010703FF9|nr:hypothetical protein [Pseudomonas sp. RIT623]TFF38138.1 hypothetical protein E3U47_16990 [Pseudomonas sp. RIT623]